MSRRGFPFPLLLLFLAFLGSAGARSAVGRARSLAPHLPPTRLTLPADYVRLASLSFRGLISDLLWIRYVQDIPLRPAGEPLGRALAAQLRMVTRLDPHFRTAYLHGSIMLTVLGNQPCAALSVLGEGARRFPGDWKLPFEAGYDCFAELGDMTCAALYMGRAASFPESPRWLPGLVGRLLTDSGRSDAAIGLLEARARNEPDPALRERFLERRGQAILARDVEVLDAAVRTWRLAHAGAVPLSLEAVVADGVIPSLPQEPFGGQYRLRADGKVINIDPAHEEPLHTYRRQTWLTGEIGERLLRERLESRSDEVLGKPWWLRERLDLIATAGGVLEQTLQGLEALLAVAPQDVAPSLRVSEGRVILEHDVRRLIDAAIDLTREHPGAFPSLGEIERRASVPAHDPFGTPYRLDETGMPAPGYGRPRLVVVRPGGGDSPCL